MLRRLICPLLALLFCACTPLPAASPTPTPVVDRLAAPPMPAKPAQADDGAYVYYQVCMACHGDRGQGLTDEWRAVWEEDANCWTSKCHGPQHPPNGFAFPKTSSPVIGPGALAGFDNAEDLHAYLVETMPWWNPGYLKPEEYWQLTAFLLRAHDALPKDVTLEPGIAAVFSLHPPAPPPGDERPAILLVTAVLAAAAGVLAIQDRLRR